MRYGKLVVAAVFALGATAAAAVLADPTGNEIGPNLLANGGFETGDFSFWSAAVDPSFSGIDDVAAHSGRFGAYFGDNGSPGSISQTFSTSVGTHYNIDLWLRSDGLTPNSFQVLWGGTTVYSAVNIAASSYTELMIDPQATSGLTTLELRARNDNGFLELDDVSVRAVAAVPEPSAFAMIAAGGLLLATYRRRSSSQER